jgi:hypothetical protein
MLQRFDKAKRASYRLKVAHRHLSSNGGARGTKRAA